MARIARKRALSQQGRSIASLLTFLGLFPAAKLWQMRTLLLIFACKGPKYADTRGMGSKIGLSFHSNELT